MRDLPICPASDSCGQNPFKSGTILVAPAPPFPALIRLTCAGKPGSGPYYEITGGHRVRYHPSFQANPFDGHHTFVSDSRGGPASAGEAEFKTDRPPSDTTD
jgi:hypothetical protein